MSFRGLTSGAGAHIPSITINFVNQGGSGYSEEKTIPAGTTISQLFQRELGGGTTPAGYVMTVRRGTQVYGGNPNNPSPNMYPLPADFILEDDDRVAITVKEMKGA
jgi:hypothetical protein